MTRHLVFSLVLGGSLAAVIACGGGAKSQTSLVGKSSPHDEIAQLDARITADLQRMNEPRPPSSAVEPLATPIPDLTKDDPTCRPAQTSSCTESCNLKKSICDAASRICTIASDLGGNDAYANEKCNSGAASCEAAKKRCCNCT